MRPTLSHLVAGGLLLVGLAASSAFSQPGSAPTPAPSPAPASSPSPEAAPAPHGAGGGPVADLKREIAGKEDQPAETVFKNVQLLKGVPAGQLLHIMESGFSPALGVRCSHCHDTKNWSSDDKKEKRASRDMMRMTQDINKTLKGIKGLDSETPQVNCTTCHRGQKKPALTMETAPAAAPGVPAAH